MKQYRITNIPDFKDGNGNWVKSYSPEPNSQFSTRAGELWGKINARCKIGGNYQINRPTYIGCINGFKDFQEFAEWCQHQYGYMNKETNGKFWQLDKDLKAKGNKIYSKDTCIFVPSRVNNLLLSSNASRGDYPLGVSFKKDKLRFVSRCNSSVVPLKTVHLGYFDCPTEAHQAWQRHKIDLIRRVVTEDEEIRNHLELVPILLAQAQRIEDDLNTGIETK